MLRKLIPFLLIICSFYSCTNDEHYFGKINDNSQDQNAGPGSPQTPPFNAGDEETSEAPGLVSAPEEGQSDTDQGATPPTEAPENNQSDVPTNAPSPESPIVAGKKLVTIGNYSDSLSLSPRRKNDSKGYQQFGLWQQSSLPGHKNSISRYSDDPSATVNYSTNDIGTGRYCVSVYRVTHENSTDKAHWTLKEGEEILHEVELAYNRPNQFSALVPLGVFHFAGGKNVSLKIERAVQANSGLLRVDEVIFKKMAEDQDCYGKIFTIIKHNALIDNKNDVNGAVHKKDDPGYRQFGEWKQSSLPGHRGLISRYSEDSEAFVTYQARVKNEEYCISLFKVLHPNRTSSAVVEIFSENQSIYAGNFSLHGDNSESGFEQIGHFTFPVNSLVTVKVSKESQATGILSADAVRFQKGQCRN